MAKTSPSTKYIDQTKLKLLNDKVTENIEELINILGLSLKKNGKMYYGSCPVHGGDRHNAFNIYFSGESFVGNWVCNTHQCQKTFCPTIIGFTRGVLSHQKYQWKHTGDKTFSFNATIDFLLNFTKQHYDNLDVDLSDLDKQISSNNTTRFYNREPRSCNSNITRKIIRQILKIPAEYYLKRGYSTQILDKYDVGYCGDTSKPMYQRCVVPVYDNEHKYMVGCTGRSVYPQCETCKTYHSTILPCPLNSDKGKYSKWKHNKGFHGEDWLYNLWYAKNHILNTKCAVLVESPGNVWRLEEAGIHNSLALFGTSLGEGQLDLLNKCGAHNLILIPDNDEAGNKFATGIYNALKLLYNIHIIKIEHSDIAEMDVENIKENIAPQIKRMYI